ncbi:hypothetical protein [Actinoplanes xinjiangensis]|uniref:hypothetical protein n=1 Tax=Actinoplanes xinjiangensis TaxID=512350 RepID=UPI00343C186C
MRIFLTLLVVAGVLLAAGLYLLPRLLANGPAVLGGLGVLLLITAAVLPRRKPKCTGHHCTGCTDH